MRKYKIVGGPKNIIVSRGNDEEAYKLFEEIILIKIINMN